MFMNSLLGRPHKRASSSPTGPCISYSEGEKCFTTGGRLSCKFQRVVTYIRS
uniref:Uncharacterized protein n=1 Tax=Anguilla anguilla TaxID=7936 RepID=A0A0E9W7D7_ANGAN